MKIGFIGLGDVGGKISIRHCPARSGQSRAALAAGLCHAARNDTNSPATPDDWIHAFGEDDRQKKRSKPQWRWFRVWGNPYFPSSVRW